MSARAYDMHAFLIYSLVAAGLHVRDAASILSPSGVCMHTLHVLYICLHLHMETGQSYLSLNRLLLYVCVSARLNESFLEKRHRRDIAGSAGGVRE